LSDSACAVGLALIIDNRLVAAAHRLIRPPRRAFTNTHLHGIAWPDVQHEPSFKTVWAGLARFWQGADYLLAHHARFDCDVLNACCMVAGHPPPTAPFICTARLARMCWHLRPSNLPAVCSNLGIPLLHHHAVSDAVACASVALRAVQEGHPLHAIAAPAAMSPAAFAPLRWRPPRMPGPIRPWRR
jgi:DNA polymerase-3 subunit epsilon